MKKTQGNKHLAYRPSFLKSFKALTLTLLGLSASANAATPIITQSTISALKLYSQMQGTFTSTGQSQNDPDFRDVTMTICEVKVSDVPGYAQGHFLYVEQALSTRLSAPYRQRFYRIKSLSLPNSSIVSTTYEPENEFVKASAVGLCSKPAEARLYSWAEIGKARCDVYLNHTGSFFGGTAPGGCPSTLYGASYMTQSFRLENGTMTTLDRGFSTDGEQVWGSSKGPYIFVKQPQSDVLFPVKAPKKTGCEISGWSLANSTTFKKVAGTWNGIWYRYDGLGKQIETYSSILEQKVENCGWVQKNSYPQADGSVKIKEFTGTVIAPGVVEFDGRNDPRFVNYNAFVKEVSDNSLVYEVKHKLTGQVTYVETITVVSPNQRLRTGTRYSERGEFLGTTVIVEKKAK